jgi:hypothetical protein
VSTRSTSRAATANTADRATNDSAPLVPTSAAADLPAAGPDPVTADRVTVREISEFLRDLAELRAGTRGDDPGARAAFLARKAELFTRLAADPAHATAPEGHTP